MRFALLPLFLLPLFLHACSDDDTPAEDAGVDDAGSSLRDATVRDAGARSDAGETDAGDDSDAGTSDAGTDSADAGPDVDAGTDSDAGTDDGATTWATYLGGDGWDSIRDAASHAGVVYVVGGTESDGFATAGSYDSTYNGGSSDVHVTAFSGDGTRLWTTYLGGPGHDRAYAVEVDDTGIYVGGRADSGMPTTAGVLQPSFGGDADVNPAYGPQDGFLAKLSLDGTRLLWLTYLGGPGREIIRDIAIDPDGNVYAAFIEVYRDVPFVSAFAFDPNRGGNEGLLAKVSPDGTTLVYASYVGGSANEEGAASVRADATGHAFYVISTRSTDAPVTAGALQTTLGGESDMLLVKVAPDGRSLDYGTYYGGSRNEGGETHNLALNDAGEAFLGAFTQSTDLPTTAGAYATTGGPGGFLARVSADGSRLVAATYTPAGEVEGVAIGRGGRVLASGYAPSGIATTAGAYQSSFGGGARDSFALVMSPNLRRVRYLTYFGGSLGEGGRTAAWNGDFAILGFETPSSDIPTTAGAHRGVLRGPEDAAMLHVLVP